jgi:hypothetical protein
MAGNGGWVGKGVWLGTGVALGGTGVGVGAHAAVKASSGSKDRKKDARDVSMAHREDEG